MRKNTKYNDTPVWEKSLKQKEDDLKDFFLDMPVEEGKTYVLPDEASEYMIEQGFVLDEDGFDTCTDEQWLENTVLPNDDINDFFQADIDLPDTEETQ